jgi:glycosyltransferase involved in cell wall biosynthesis
LDRHLHIVTHQVPWPADFGGVIDLFYKIKALHEQGIKIHLHCFTKVYKTADTLNTYCSEIRYYARKPIWRSFPWKLPHIVSSRNSRELYRALSKDDHPVLLEGIHCSYLLNKDLLAGRKVFLRLHNVEYIYYKQLASLEKNLIRKIYYGLESYLLRKYERGIANKAMVLTVSEIDKEVYKNEFHARQIHFMPVFLPYGKVQSKPGKGSMCLYHGNLAINENQRAVHWLFEEIFQNSDIPLVIAGKDPPADIMAMANKRPQTLLIKDPGDEQLADLIAHAQVNVLPSFNSTGVKLKLLAALFSGRHCLVNEKTAAGSGVENACHIAHSVLEFKMMLEELYNTPFSAEDIRERTEKLSQVYDNANNARQFISWVY